MVGVKKATHWYGVYKILSDPQIHGKKGSYKVIASYIDILEYK